VCETVDQVIHAELIRLVGLIERTKAPAGPLPELRDVGVVVDDGHQTLASIVVLEDALENRIAADISVCVDAPIQPDRITFDIPPGRRIVITIVVVVQPRLPIEDLARQTQVVGL